MKIFDNLITLERIWEEISRRPLNEEEKAMVAKATVIRGQYGRRVCFMLVSGRTCEIPLDDSSNVPVGTEVNVENIEVITLKCIKGEEAVIQRININNI